MDIVLDCYTALTCGAVSGKWDTVCDCLVSSARFASMNTDGDLQVKCILGTAMFCGLMWPVGILTVFHRPVTVRIALKSGNCLPLGLHNETVKKSSTSTKWKWHRTSPWPKPRGSVWQGAISVLVCCMIGTGKTIWGIYPLNQKQILDHWLITRWPW